MNQRMLFNRVISVLIALLLYIGAGALLFHYLNESWYRFFQDTVPVALGIPLAYLAYCFQRRHSYLNEMRELWRNLIPAIQTIIQYTHLSHPTQEQFSEANIKVSSAIDYVRSVFSNLPKTRTPTGLYPYENLKDISLILRWLGPWHERDESERKIARACITRLWQEMYNMMLLEFDRSPPIKGVSKFFYDPPESVADLLVQGRLQDTDLDWRKSAPSHPRVTRRWLL